MNRHCEESIWTTKQSFENFVPLSFVSNNKLNFLRIHCSIEIRCRHTSLDTSIVTVKRVSKTIHHSLSPCGRLNEVKPIGLSGVKSVGGLGRGDYVDHK